MRMKTQRGITLFALIITVIVLAILTAVTVNSIKDNGIIQKAKTSTTEYERLEEKKKLQREVLEWQANSAGTLLNYMITIYGDSKVNDNGDGTLTVIVPSENLYNVTESGKVTLKTEPN